jgi:hypothetical protein
MSYEIAGVVGDVNPIQYGGWLVGLKATHVDAIVIEPIDWEENGKRQGDGVDCLTYTVALDRFKLVCDVADPINDAGFLVPDSWNNSWPWGPTNHEWWDEPEFHKNFTESTNLPWSDFVESICSDDPIKRACAWQEIASYYGIQNLDDQPIRETEAELKKKFALPFYRARKRGIRVYL